MSREEFGDRRWGGEGGGILSCGIYYGYGVSGGESGRDGKMAGFRVSGRGRGRASLRRSSFPGHKPRGVLDVDNEEAVLALVHDAIDIHVNFGKLRYPFRDTPHLHAQRLHAQTATDHRVRREILQ